MEKNLSSPKHQHALGAKSSDKSILLLPRYSLQRSTEDGELQKLLLNPYMHKQNISKTHRQQSQVVEIIGQCIGQQPW